MKRERNTLVGTPTVVAPGALFLVGEFALPDEQVAVLAALSSYATAQYFPKVDPLSPLVATVVERSRAHLGEAAAALPAGSVLLSPPEDRGEGFIFETTPSIAVAATAAVFEAAGQSISERKDEILLVALASHRAVYNGVGAEGELAAALRGGLTKVVSQPDAWPRIEALAPPAGLQVVVFRMERALFPLGWLASVQKLAQRDPVAYARIVNELFEQADNFAAGLSRDNATAAIASAGRYGHCITQLAAAASVPLQSKAFVQAVELAKEIGGIAKTTSHGQLGIAMFARPEAASLFVRACQPPLVPLGVDLDRSGVRCLGPSQTREHGAVHTPAPETGPSSISAEAVVRAAIEDHTTEKMPPNPPAEAFPTPQPAVIQGEHLAPQAQLLSGAELMPEDVPAPPRSYKRIGPIIAGALIAGALLIGWLTTSLGRHNARPVTTDSRPALHLSSLPADGTHGPTAPAAPPAVQPAPTPAETAARPVVPPSDQEPPVKPQARTYRSHAFASGKASGKRPPLPSTVSPKAPAVPREPPKQRPLRAGKLSPDDF